MLEPLITEVANRFTLGTEETRKLYRLLVVRLGGDPHGLGALLDRADALGMANLVESWLGPDPDEPIAPGQVDDLLGAEAIEYMADRLGITGSAVSGAEGWVPLAGIVWCFGLPSVLLTAAVVRMDDAPPGATRWRVVAALLLGLANPLGDYFIGSAAVGYVSHDYTPWVEAVSAVLLLSAALIMWPSTRGRAPAGGPAPASHPQDGQFVTT